MTTLFAALHFNTRHIRSMRVDWRRSVVFGENRTVEADARSQLWSELCKPEKSHQIQGNETAIANMKHWFDSRRQDVGGNACLAVIGPCGVGKSTAVDLCAAENGFDVEHTYANVARTPQKLEAIMVKLTMRGQQSVLVLDDFESFITETTSMRDIVKFAKAVGRQGNKQTLVIICNAIDKSFQPILEVSTAIQFHAAEPAYVQRVLRKVATSVSRFCYVPPMDIFFIAQRSTGDIRQTINQMQFSHHNTAGTTTAKRKPIRVGDHADSSSRRWFTTHRSTSLHCFTKNEERSAIDNVWSMSKGFHMGVRDHLHRDYASYFHNSTHNTMRSMWQVAEEVSACDTTGPDEEDGLYDTENRELWATDNISAVAHISTAIWLVRGRKMTPCRPKRRKRKRMGLEFRGHEETGDIFRTGKALNL